METETDIVLGKDGNWDVYKCAKCGKPLIKFVGDPALNCIVRYIADCEHFNVITFGNLEWYSLSPESPWKKGRILSVFTSTTIYTIYPKNFSAYGKPLFYGGDR